MSWREICKIQGLSKAASPVFRGTDKHKKLAIAARQRVFGGVPLEGTSEHARYRGINAANRLLLSKHDKDTFTDQLQYPYVRPEILSGRTYREREKLQAKVQAGIKGPAAGAADDAKDKKKKK